VGVMRTVTPHSSQGCRSTRLPLNPASLRRANGSAQSASARGP